MYECTSLEKPIALLQFLTSSERAMQWYKRPTFIFYSSIFSFETVPVQVLGLKLELLLTSHCAACVYQFC